MRARAAAALFAAVVAGVAGSTIASGAPATLVSRSAVGGVSLGLGRATYTARLGRPDFTTRYGNGLTRVTFRNGAIHVYVSRGRGVALLTSDADYKTAAGVGPCSTETVLRRAYRRSLVPVRLGRNGQLVGYRLGSLVFVVSTQRVRLVMLAKASFPVRIAVNSGACGIGEEG